jgi:hypothetical protein
MEIMKQIITNEKWGDDSVKQAIISKKLRQAL